VGVPAPASVPEFLVKLIAEKYQLDLVAAPYRGSAPMMSDMLGNQIAAGVGSIPDFIENHRSGKLRVVGVLGGARQAVMPEVPTFSELGLTGFEDVPYYGLFAPAGTPRAAIDTISAAVAKVLARPALRERLTAMGLAVEHMSADQLGQRERAYTATWHASSRPPASCRSSRRSMRTSATSRVRWFAVTGPASPSQRVTCRLQGGLRTSCPSRTGICVPGLNDMRTLPSLPSSR